MYQRAILFTFAAILLLSIAACKKNDPVPVPLGRCEIVNPPCDISPPSPDPECSGWNPAIGIASISGNTTGYVGVPLFITAYATATNGCGVSAAINGSWSGNTVTLTGQINYIGCICTAALEDIAGTYTFTPSQAGVYQVSATDYQGNVQVLTIQVQ